MAGAPGRNMRLHACPGLRHHGDATAILASLTLIDRMVKEGRLTCHRLTDAPASPMLFDRAEIVRLATEL